METKEPSKSRRPWHLWVVGIFALLWSLLGVTDYLMTQTRNEQYMSQFTPEQLEYFYNVPAWMVSAWAIGVWGGFLGAILLLLRKRLAEWVFLASLVAFLVTVLYSYGLSNGAEIMGDLSVVFTAVIFFLSLGLYLYASAMRKRQVLA